MTVLIKIQGTDNLIIYILCRKKYDKQGDDMKRIVDYARVFIKDYISSGDCCVDFTMGNGHDTLFLAKQCYPGKVVAFDIQLEAIENTKQLLMQENIDNVTLILESHEHFDHYVDRFKVGIFNFGYLPNSAIIQPTLLQSSQIAVEKALEHLQVKGILLLVLYPGHYQGKEECDFFDERIYTLDPYYYESFLFKMAVKRNCPYILGIEKKREKKV